MFTRLAGIAAARSGKLGNIGEERIFIFKHKQEN